MNTICNRNKTTTILSFHPSYFHHQWKVGVMGTNPLLNWWKWNMSSSLGHRLEVVLPSPTFVISPLAQNVIYPNKHNYNTNILQTPFAISTKLWLHWVFSSTVFSSQAKGRGHGVTHKKQYSTHEYVCVWTGEPKKIDPRRLLPVWLKPSQ